MSKNKYTLVIAIHRGTIMSRDIDNPIEFDTDVDAMKEFYRARKQYKRFGYKIWFATLTDPEGNESTLEQNPYTS